MHEIIYYSTAIISLLTFLVASSYLKIKLVSFSSISYLFAFITAILPGYEVINGNFYGNRFSRGFDETLYYIYLIFSVFFPLFLTLGNIIGKKYYLYTEARNKLHLRMNITIGVILLYTLMYLIWIPENPLNNLIRGQTDLYELAIQRILITHQLGGNEQGVPFLFRYWRNIMQNLFFIAIIYLLIEHRNNKRYSNVVMFVLTLMLVYNLTFTFEKATLIYFIIALISLKAFNNPMNYKMIITSAFFVMAASLGMITVFMGATNLYDAIEALILRVTEQTCSTYLQIEYIRQNGFIFFRGIYAPLFNNIFPDYYVDLSKIAYEEIFSVKDAGTPSGSAAGMALADLYFMFSWYALPIYCIFMCMYGAIDAILINSTSTNNLSAEVKSINTSFYIYFMSNFSLVLTGTVFGILSPPFVFSPVVIIIIAFYFIYIKFRNISLRKF